MMMVNIELCVLTADSFANEALLSLGEHQTAQSTKCVWTQVTSWWHRQCCLHCRHYVCEYPAGLLHTNIHC